MLTLFSFVHLLQMICLEVLLRYYVTHLSICTFVIDIINIAFWVLFSIHKKPRMAPRMVKHVSAKKFKKILLNLSKLKPSIWKC
jgi:hypothetical protein